MAEPTAETVTDVTVATGSTTTAEPALIAAARRAVVGKVRLESPYERPLSVNATTLVREYDAALAAARVDALANPRDAYHTMDELYEYRMLYNALAANEWAKGDTVPVVKSWNHSDGEPCFGGGWFIVVATLPTGQVSNHYKAEHWDLFMVPEVALSPEYDGHTPQEASRRMQAYLLTQSASRAQ